MVSNTFWLLRVVLVWVWIQQMTFSFPGCCNLSHLSMKVECTNQSCIGEFVSQTILLSSVICFVVWSRVLLLFAIAVVCCCPLLFVAAYRWVCCGSEMTELLTITTRHVVAGLLLSEIRIGCQFHIRPFELQFGLRCPCELLICPFELQFGLWCRSELVTCHCAAQAASYVCVLGRLCLIYVEHLLQLLFSFS